ncbi:hypothetical protein GF380_02200 [Candidatus Uhrbacteria bacterium]|nr:hypothetical protein [Candidatus Uhrbacteria bacterium]MBD3284028.1 hypothetical protein [Candidatus Uhrbacteria bacterium]
MRSRYRGGFIALILMIGVVFVVPATQAAYGTHQPPKIMNLWFDWQLRDADVQELAKWDVVVIDMDQQTRYAERVRKLRRLNPNIKILAYISSANIAAARFVEEKDFPGYALAHSIPEAWYMHRGKERVGFWVGAWLLNVTQDSPRDRQGRRWIDFLPEFIDEELMSTGLWDGVFLDDALPGATWFVGGGLDMNGDGIADSDDAVNASWNRGWTEMAQHLRERLGPDALIMGNGSPDYASVTNGILFESFPNNGWVEGFRNYQTAYHYNPKPSITAINSNTNNVDHPTDYRAMRLGLGTSMLANGYYSFDFGPRDHGQLWWYDEYDADLGAPAGLPTLLEPANQRGVHEGVWWRDYEQGAVVVNSSRQTQRIALDVPYERLRGNQDPVTNSGHVESSLELPARDALLLYRRVGTTTLGRTTGFRNGSFVRVYDESGQQVRSGFFAQRSDASGGASVVQEDVDRDGRLDIVTGYQGTVRVRYANGQGGRFTPFGSGFGGGLQLAVGNVDRDDPWEIVVGQEGGGQVRVLERSGQVRATWDAYVPWFKGGVNVAIGNLDGDDKREIITGAGPTGGPHIRIFKTDGELWGGGFFAFDQRERGGVSVAVGDVNGDGKDEIIAGSGQGSIPRVRIFNARGTLLREFTLEDRVSATGVSVSVSDIDDDGIPEILASGVQPI